MGLTFQRPRLEGYLPSGSAIYSMHLNSPQRRNAADLDVAAVTSSMQRGEEAAFREFYDGYYDRLYRYLIVLTRGQEDTAREILQTTMIKVTRSIKPFAEERSLWNWLAAIARNGFFDALRKARRSPVVVPLFSDDTETEILPEPPQDDTSLYEVLDDCLRDMPEHDRRLLERFYFEEASHQTLAEQTGTTPKAVESKLARVREKLRKTFFQRLKHER
jgi:RNA polymerase sigma-70 factor, ECF subfamily